MIIYKCDKCKTEFDYNPDPIENPEYKYQISKFDDGIFSSIHLCKECQNTFNNIIDEFLEVE